jgi:hypothetical protein
MQYLISLLLDVVKMVESEQGAWAIDVKMNCCMMMDEILSRNYRSFSLVVDCGTERDLLTFCVDISELIESADCGAALKGVLSERLQTITSKVLTLSLSHNETSPIPCDVVSHELAMQSLQRQLNL